MAWVKKRNSAKGVRWTGVYKDGDSERTAGTFARKADALLAADEAERRVRLGEALPVRRKAPKIEDFGAHYLATAGTHGSVITSSRSSRASASTRSAPPMCGDS